MSILLCGADIDVYNYHLDTLQLYAIPEIEEGAIFQQDGAPPNYANTFREFLDTFPQRWI